MSKKNIAVLDFGTSHVSVLIGDRSVNGTFDVRGFAQSSYSGFLNGEILEPELLNQVLTQTIQKAEQNARVKITHLYVGVPAEFCMAEVRVQTLNFDKKRRITERDIEQVFAKADEFGSSPTHLVINRSPICYELDNQERVIDPKGRATTSLTATLSFMLCERNFVGTISQAIHELNIPFVEFISETLAEAMFLLEPEQRDRCAILVDCGYLSTSVAVVVGDGIVHLRSFSLGGGMITADLAEMLQIPFEVAEILKQNIALTGQPSENEKMSVTHNGQVYQFETLAVYEITMRKIRQIAKMISKSLETCEYECPDYVPISLTGGGISYIKGVCETLRGLVGKEVRVIAPDIPQMSEPTNSAVLGLLDLALRQNHASLSFFIKIFKKQF